MSTVRAEDSSGTSTTLRARPGPNDGYAKSSGTSAIAIEASGGTSVSTKRSGSHSRRSTSQTTSMPPGTSGLPLAFGRCVFPGARKLAAFASNAIGRPDCAAKIPLTPKLAGACPKIASTRVRSPPMAAG